MKVLHVASGDLWGGAEAQLSALCAASVQQGASVSVVLLNRNSELGRRVVACGAELLELDETRMSTIGIARAVRAHVRKIRPDVIHTHRFKENIIGGAVARLAGVASVRTMHGAPEPELLNRTMRRRCLDFVDATVARRLQHRVVAVSDELAVRMRAALPGAHVVVIRNGVDVDELRRRAALDAGVPARKPGVARIGFFGRLVPVKRVDLLLESFAQLRTLRSAQAELYIVGDGAESEALQQLAHRLDLKGSVHFVGFQDNASAWIRAMDCTVLTSDHEGLPMIVLESLALGVPMVARAVGGIPEVLQPVDASWLVPGNDAGGIARALERTLAARNESNPKSLLPEQYTAQVMAREYLQLYASVTQGRR